jgi:hypothetical protein
MNNNGTMVVDWGSLGSPFCLHHRKISASETPLPPYRLGISPFRGAKPATRAFN